MPPSTDFDWVTARTRCNAGQTFDQLRWQVKANVQTRNDTINHPVPETNRPNEGPLLYTETVDRFSVTNEDKRVEVERSGVDRIEITGTGVVPRIKHVTVRLGADGECEVVDPNEKPISLWRILPGVRRSVLRIDAARSLRRRKNRPQYGVDSDLLSHYM